MHTFLHFLFSFAIISKRPILWKGTFSFIRTIIILYGHVFWMDSMAVLTFATRGGVSTKALLAPALPTLPHRHYLTYTSTWASESVARNEQFLPVSSLLLAVRMDYCHHFSSFITQCLQKVFKTIDLFHILLFYSLNL